MKLFLGPGSYLIQPTCVGNTYTRHKVPFGWWYTTAPFALIRPASYLEIYIMSKYSLCKPKD